MMMRHVWWKYDDEVIDIHWKIWLHILITEMLMKLQRIAIKDLRCQMIIWQEVMNVKSKLLIILNTKKIQ